MVGATLAPGQNLPTFQHIIVIIQENRSPDNLFGSNPTFVPGVDIQQPAQGQWCLGACFNPGHAHVDWEGMWNHGNGNGGVCGNKFGNDCGNGSSTITYCNGEIVNHDLNVPSCPQETYVSAGYDSSVVQPYFDIATKYGFANYFFQSNQGPSMPAHQFLFTGTSSPSGVRPQEGALNFFQAENPPTAHNQQDNTGCTAPAGQTVQLIDQNGLEGSTSQYKIFPCFSHNTLSTLLEPSRITWRYYTNQPTPTSTNTIWNAPAAIYGICFPPDQTGTVCTGSDYVNNVVVNNPAQVLIDLGGGSPATCALQQVSWVIPNGDRSDHPGFQGNENDSHQIEGGPSWVADIINTLGNDPGKCGYWNNTAVFVVWDDWGGWWDHISPYEVLINNPPAQTCDPNNTFGCGYVSGFRVPFLVVSAYTGTLSSGVYSGYVSGACGASPLPPCPNEAFPYKHDFGSILAFIENNFLGSTAIGSINAQNNYKFADAFAPDYRAQPLNIPLADFFPLSTPRPFQAIALPPGAPDANYFINYNGPILDPDNDGIDND